MKELNFKYLNKNGEKSDRKVIVIEDTNDYIEGIDLTRLPETKAKTAVSMAMSSDFDPKNFMDAYRKFTKKSMTNVSEVVL